MWLNPSGPGRDWLDPILHAMHDREDQRAYCLAFMVPVWERWTDGNTAARRLLECESPDPTSHEERLRRLTATTTALRTHYTSPSCHLMADAAQRSDAQGAQPGLAARPDACQCGRTDRRDVYHISH
jgi:hypothetical protein